MSFGDGKPVHTLPRLNMAVIGCCMVIGDSPSHIGYLNMNAHTNVPYLPHKRWSEYRTHVLVWPLESTSSVVLVHRKVLSFGCVRAACLRHGRQPPKHIVYQLGTKNASGEDEVNSQLTQVLSWRCFFVNCINLVQLDCCTVNYSLAHLLGRSVAVCEGLSLEPDFVVFAAGQRKHGFQ